MIDLPRSVERIVIETPRRQVWRLLGIRPHQRPPRESLQRIFDEEYETARELLEPQAVLEVRHGLPGSRTVEPEMPVALAVCTVGGSIDDRVRRLGEKGDSTRAMILDAIGSAAVEEVADRTNGRICELALGAGHLPAMRRSPGYGRWEIGEQRLIFDLLDPGEIGVRLNDTGMMVPNKSISYLVPLEGGRPGRQAKSRCERCGFTDCTYRDCGEESR